MNFFLLTATLLPLAATGSGNSPKQTWQGILALPNNGSAVAIEISEFRDSRYRPVALDPSLEPVSPDGKLVLKFPAPRSETFQGSPPEWKQLNNLLDTLARLVESRQRHANLLLEVESGKVKQTEALRASTLSFDDQVDEYESQVKHLLGPTEYSLLEKEALNRAESGATLEELSGEWIKRRLEKLSSETSKIIANAKSSATITVQAFLKNSDGGTTAIHVDGYDNIPTGSLELAGKTDLGLSASEYARLRNGYELASHFSEGIQEIQQNIGTIRAGLNETVKKILQKIEGTANRFRDRVSFWENSLANAEKHLTALTAGGGTVGVKAKALEEHLAGIRRDIGKMRATVAAFDDLKRDLEARPLASLRFLFGEENSVTRLRQSLGELHAAAELWPQTFSTLRNLLQDLGKELAGSEHAAVRDALTGLGQDVLSDLEKQRTDLTALLQGALNSLGAAQSIARDVEKREATIQAISEAELQPTPRGLDELVPATIDLRTAGARTGDTAMIRVSIQDSSDPVRKRSLEYKFEVRPVGWHREFSGQLVFATPQRGPQSGTFETSAAVLATWQRGVEHPRGLTSIWHAANPGFGVHAATLNQGNATTETGLGFAFSLRDNLFTGGIGWNLAVRDNRQYYFIGIGLLELLQQFKKIRPGDLERR